MDPRTYQMTVQLDVEAATPPTPDDVARYITDHLNGLEIHSPAGIAHVTEVEAIPDPITHSDTPLEMADAVLGIISAHIMGLRTVSDGTGRQHSVEEGIQRLEAGVSFLRGVFCHIEECSNNCPISNDASNELLFRKMKLEDAPHEILQYIAQKMEIAGAENMERPQLLAELSRKMKGEPPPEMN